jgi:hypothetical protein
VHVLAYLRLLHARRLREARKQAGRLRRDDHCADGHSVRDSSARRVCVRFLQERRWSRKSVIALTAQGGNGAVYDLATTPGSLRPVFQNPQGGVWKVSVADFR